MMPAIDSHDSPLRCSAGDICFYFRKRDHSSRGLGIANGLWVELQTKGGWWSFESCLGSFWNHIHDGGKDAYPPQQRLR